jgi:hypothetical protein
LRNAEFEIVAAFKGHNYAGRERFERHRILQWAILQHYEICPTPLLDVTHSLRVAASFATDSRHLVDPLVCVLAAPNLAGSVTASSEQGIQIIRLTSICPPEAKRPYFQEGYLIGEYPDLVSYDEKRHYKPFEVDFGLRLLAKFRLNPNTFWSDKNFTPIPRDALYPDDRDPLSRIAKNINRTLNPL